MILVSDYFVHKVRQPSIIINNQRLRPLIAFAAIKAAGNRVLLVDLFPFINKDPSHRRLCRNAMDSIVQLPGDPCA